PSIASVSQVEILSKTPAEKEAHLLKIHGGVFKSLTPAVFEKGTKVSVQNLFYNIPARLKFLKTDSTEKRKIATWVESIALVNPQISFKLRVDGKDFISFSRKGTLKDRLIEAYDSEIIKSFYYLKFNFHSGNISGVISKPELFKRDRSEIRTFVNSRLVQNPLLNYSISSFFRDKMPHGNFPYVILLLTIKPELVDVNVHPAKLEVRFRNEDEIVSLCLRAFNQAYSTHINQEFGKNDQNDLVFQNVKESKKVPINVSTVLNDLFSIPSQIAVSEKTNDLFYNKESFSKTENRQISQFNYIPETNVQLIGQSKNRYLVVEFEDSIGIIDQHAAHERILYEKTCFLKKESKIESQQLLIPEIIKLSFEDFGVIEENMNILNDFGFSINTFGGNTIKIDGVPALVTINNLKNYFVSLIAFIKDSNFGKPDEDKVIRGICRQSVMFGDKLNDAEQREILTELFKCKNPFTCPHGRNIIFKLPFSELNRKFGR
ncbi:MAG: hypothetical protein ACD_79C00481G0001, partial [uncultured bacterium]